jgi:hypothetical protein
LDNEANAGWRSMDSAPRDGTRILVALTASEQGPAEVDMVRWARPERNAEECWLATDSDAGSPVVYSSSDLSSWMPLPSPMPRLRSRPGGPDETDGSAI